MDTQTILSYLKNLNEHNDREWYHAHKTEYKEASALFETLVHELILQIGKFDSSILPREAKELTFKLVRDTRFSHDKSPYNPTVRAHIGPEGKLPVPVGYYLMIKPGCQSFLGGGLFANSFRKEHPQAQWLKFKSWYLEYPVPDEMLADAEAFVSEEVKMYRIMKPFKYYLIVRVSDANKVKL